MFIPTKTAAALKLGAVTLLIAGAGFALHARAAVSPAPAARAAVAPQVQLPPPEALVILIRSSIVALSQANVTNNYSVLNAMGSKTFRTANSPQSLANAFAQFRANNIDLSPTVYLSPQLTAAPTVQNGQLRLIGFFPSSPMRVNFDLSFEPDQAQWKLLNLGVNLSQNVAPANNKAR